MLKRKPLVSSVKILNVKPFINSQREPGIKSKKVAEDATNKLEVYMTKNCSAVKPKFSAPPPGMSYKIECKRNAVFYLGSCPEGKARAFAKHKNAVNLWVWKAKGWVSLGIETPDQEKLRKKLSKNT